MSDLYDQALENMERTVHDLANRVPPPVQVRILNKDYFRYREKSIYQALVQKLARLLSTLHAARLLMKHGFVQEQASLQRILDDIAEDITFLSIAVIHDDMTELHRKYLDAFYKEEFDAESALASTQKRPMIRRDKIQAYIAKKSADMDPSTVQEAARTLSKIYSGYVHAASPQIMDMYGGIPPQFHVRGMSGTLRHREHCADIWNYFYRSMVAFQIAVGAFGDTELALRIKEFIHEFESQSGEDYLSKEWRGI